MQIEQVIGGVNGDVTSQAIQLRMRANGQNLVSNSRIRAWDAAGANPVLISDITTNVPIGTTGARVLLTSAAFNNDTSPATVPNFPMTNLIPASYLAAGSLTFESNSGSVLWRLSWGGAAYTGACTGTLDNDADGNFCPAFAGPLPSTSLQALKFQGVATALSTNNAANYALTPAAATFINNAGTNFVLVGPEVGACCLGSGECISSQQATECNTLGGVWQGANSTCDSGCPQPVGACCLPEEICKELTEADCLAAKGIFAGTSTTCESVSCLKPCLADISPEGGNGVVDVDDLLEVINEWGACKSCHADINLDGQVNVDDLLAIINGWGPCD